MGIFTKKVNGEKINKKKPKNPKKGDKFIQKMKNKSGKHKVIMENTGKEGFGAWKIKEHIDKGSKR